MTVLRTDIERALDDLISNEEGMRFQGLAVVLPKQHWPDLVASERKKDLGADAIGLFVLSSRINILKRTSCEKTPTSRKPGISNHLAFIGTSKGGIRLPLSIVTRSPCSNKCVSGWSRGSSFGMLSCSRISLSIISTGVPARVWGESREAV
jgi:hypothetical protein